MTTRYFLVQSLSLFAVFLLGHSSLFSEEVKPMQPVASEFTFEQHEVVIGSAKHRTVLTGFLLGSTIAELAVVNIDENNDRRLCIYAFGDSTWVPILDATLRSEVLFVDVANIDGRDRLITYEPGRLNWFDPESAAEHALMEITSNFNPPLPGPNLPYRRHTGFEWRRTRRSGSAGHQWLLGVYPDERWRVRRSSEDRSFYRDG